ncbi:MAG: hypothetical protein ABS56_00625 [Lautropia sp. SCN 69-89]|nr:MAG: hypothetical protein ABS56_00625 [Lautropia sp. SCN 69-89]
MAGNRSSERPREARLTTALDRRRAARTITVNMRITASMHTITASTRTTSSMDTTTQRTRST